MANCIWYSKVSKFLENFTEEILEDSVKLLRNNFDGVFGGYPSFEEEFSWRSTVRYLRGVLTGEAFQDLYVLLEYKLPFSGERIDAVVMGLSKSNRPIVLVIEFKGWEKISAISDTFVRVKGKREIHPEYQLRNYMGKLDFAHSAFDNGFGIKGFVVLHNVQRDACDVEFKAPCFMKDEDSQFADSLRSVFSETPISEEQGDHFVNGTYVQNERLFDAIRDYFEPLRESSYYALAQKGFGLSNEQLQLVEDVLSDLKTGKKNVTYLVQGLPGSGKTLVAIHILMSSLRDEFNSVLGYRNNRMINCLRQIFGSKEGGLDSVILFFSTGRPTNPGIAEEGYKYSHDIVVFDEAQRMIKENIRLGSGRGDITVFFFDETQILNAEEEGTNENFEKMVEEMGREIKRYTLKGFYRQTGGEKYHKWVESVLASPSNAGKLPVTPEEYDFGVFEDIGDIISKLRERVISKGTRAGLIASFTESPGDNKNTKSLKNLRIGYPLFSGFEGYKEFGNEIFWLMDAKKDYPPFWVEGECNKLEKCSSIYGCQGFEIDFAGIVWGRDLVYRNGEWALGDNCEDSVGYPRLKTIFMKGKAGDKESYEIAIRLLVNRYRIFLTRGMKGTHVYCEDQETSEFFKKLQV